MTADRGAPCAPVWPSKAGKHGVQIRVGKADDIVAFDFEHATSKPKQRSRPMRGIKLAQPRSPECYPQCYPLSISLKPNGLR